MNFSKNSRNQTMQQGIIELFKSLALTHAGDSYQYSAKKVCNDIPIDTREFPAFGRFKNKLKEWLRRWLLTSN